MTTEEEINFDIKKVDHENFSGLKNLMQQCFGIGVEDAYCDWKYVHNPAGKLVAYEAFHKNSLAGFYGLIPEFFMVGGKRTKIYQSMDTMTHPLFQRRGLFVQLANRTFADLLTNERSLDMIGIPGGNSFHGFVNRLGWRCIHRFRFLFIHRFIFTIRGFFRPSSKLDVQEIPSMSDALAAFLLDKEPSPLPIYPDWNPEVFAWRVYGDTHNKFRVLGVFEQKKLLGICVYALDARGRPYIYLLEFLRQEYFMGFSASVIREIFKREKSNFIYTWEPTNGGIRRAYMGLGFIFNPWRRGPFSYRVPFITRSESGIVNGLDWNDINNFDLQPLIQD